MKAVVVFVAVAYGLSIALGAAVGFTGGYQSPVVGLGFLSMVLPTAAMLAARLASKENIAIDWNHLPLRYLPMALCLMPVVLHVVMLSRLAAAGPLPWPEWLTRQADGLFHTPASRSWGAVTMTGLVETIGLNAFAGVVVVSTLALFEEIGWRGWLLSRLADRLGARLGIVVTSVLWALWHVPFALGGIGHIDGISPGLLAVSWPVGIFATGLVIGWLWVRTRSIWIVASAHGALNNWGQLAFKYLGDFDTPSPLSLAASGFFAVAIVGALLVWFALPTRFSNGPAS